MSFFGFLFTVFAVYVTGMLLYLFFKFVLPLVLTVRKLKNQSGAYNRQRTEEVFSEGDVSLEKPASGQKNGKKINDDIGEPVDYQEIN